MRATVLCAAVFLLQACSISVAENHFFVPGPAESSARAQFAIEGTTHEDFEIVAPDGAVLGGVYLRRAGAGIDVLYFGGNVFRIDDAGQAIGTAFSGAGANVMLVDYRGYGRSNGSPDLAALKADALAAYDNLAARVAGRPIVVHGFSLGSFVAAHVAANRPVAGLVLESTAPDVESWARKQIPLYAKPFVRVSIADALRGESNATRLQAYRGPLLLVTGSRDTVTPPAFARQLLRRSATPAEDKRLLIADGAVHGNALAGAKAREGYREFLATVRGER